MTFDPNATVDPTTPVTEGTPVAGMTETGIAGLVPGGTPGQIQTGPLPQNSDAETFAADALKQVEDNYPEFVWMLYTPLGPDIIKWAQEGTPAADIQAQLEANPIWNQMSQAVQSTLMQLSTSPGQFLSTLQTQEQTVQSIFNQLGLQPTQGQINSLSFMAIMNGWTQPNDQRLMNHIRQSIKINPDGTMVLTPYYKDPTTGQNIDVFSGRQAYYGPNNEPATPDKALAEKTWGQNYGTYKMDDGTTVYYGMGTTPMGTGQPGGGPPKGGGLVAIQQQLKTLSSQYLVPMTDQQLAAQANNIEFGQQTVAGFTAYLKTLALSKFGNNPDMVAAIQRGQTPDQYLDPYRSEFGNVLSIDPNSIDFNDPKWASLLTQTDPKTGMTASTPIWQAVQQIRSNPSFGWQNTPNARSAAYSVASGLAQTFGLENFGGENFGTPSQATSMGSV